MANIPSFTVVHNNGRIFGGFDLSMAKVVAFECETGRNVVIQIEQAGKIMLSGQELRVAINEIGNARGYEL